MKGKKILIAVLGCSVVLNSIIFASSNTGDVILNKSKVISKELLNKANEGNDIQLGDLSATYIKGLNQEEDYILVEGKESGYVVLDNDTMEIIEFSDLESSPYQEYSKNEAYYAGPMQYYTDEKNGMRNLESDKVISKENANEIGMKIKEKINNNRDKRKNKTHTKQEKESNLDKKDPGATGSSVIDADAYTYLTRKYIDYYRYFIGNEEHGNNVDDTCCSVAAQLLLAYNNWLCDGTLIPAIPKAGEVFLPLEWDEYEKDPYSKVRIATTSSDERNDDVISFYERIKSYINPFARSADEVEAGEPESIFNGGATMLGTYNGIQQYLNNYAPLTKSLISMDYRMDLSTNPTGDIERLKEEIDSNRPAIGGLTTYRLESNGEYSTGGHAVVVYGYQTILFNDEEIEGFVVHYGHKNRNRTNVWVNSSWFDGYVTFKTLHTHNDVEIDAKNHIYKCMNCTRTRQSVTHNYKPFKPLENVSTLKYNTYHIAMCECGATRENLHVFSYRAIDNVWHIKKCACGYEIQDRHFNKVGNSCWHCGYNS